MKIFVKVKPNSKVEDVKCISKDTFFVHVKQPAKQGKANFALIKCLARYFNTSQSMIKIVSGQTANKKIVQVE